METIIRRHIILKCFYLILLFCPFLLASFYSSKVILGRYETFDYARYFFDFGTSRLIPFVFSVITILIIISLFSLIKTIKTSKTLIVFLVFIIAFLPRFFIFKLFYHNLNFYSDFFQTWTIAIGDIRPIKYYKLFPAYMNYSLFLKFICDHFSLYDGIRAIVFFNVLFTSLTAVGVFLLGNRIINNVYYGFLAAIIYAVFPSRIFYSLTNSPEHLCICCNIFALYLLTFICSEKKISIKAISIICIAGVLFGIAASIKTFFPIIFISFIIAKLYFYLSSSNKTFKTILSIVCSFFVLFFAEQMTLKIITSLSEKTFSVSLDFSDATPHYLSIGLDRQSEGQYHYGAFSRKYIEMRLSGMSKKDARTIALNDIINDWKGNNIDLVPFFISRTTWAWQDDCMPIAFFLNTVLVLDETENGHIFFKDFFGREGVNKDSFKYHFYRRLKKHASAYTEILYFMLMVIGCFGCVFKAMKSSTINIYIFIMDLTILGFFCLMLISEVQSRYKCLIFPFICLHVAFFFYNIKNCLFITTEEKEEKNAK